jgi:hypothetical protein
MKPGSPLDATSGQARRKAGIVVVICGVTTACIVLVLGTRNHQAGIGPAAPAKGGPPPATAKNAAAPEAGCLAASPSPASAVHFSPALLLRLTASRADEPKLPAAPTGDYDLTVSPDEFAAIMERRYGNLLRNLGLAPERLARLFALLAERQLVGIDAANAAMLTGLDTTRDLPTILRAIQEAQAGVDAVIRDELGEAIFSACRDSDRVLREKKTVADLGRVLDELRCPLTPGQSEQMTRTLSASPVAEASPVDIGRAIFGEIHARAQISDAAITSAATILSPAQLNAFRQLQHHWATETARPQPNEKQPR